MSNLEYNNIQEEAQFRILDFLNSAQSFDELTDSKSLRGYPVISSLIALRILEKRELCSDKVFTSLSDLEGIVGFDQEKLNELAYALDHDTGSAREAHIDLDGIKSNEHNPDAQAEEKIELEDKDIGSLEKVLRTYYLSQIKSLEGRKNRRLARRLIEHHLVLPISKQRTSKDQAYIKEILGIGIPLLSRLENTRLIRKFTQIGKNPIYEVSHDSLVEPILAERQNDETLMKYLRKWAVYYFLALGVLIYGGWYLGHILNPPKYEKIMLKFSELPLYVDSSQLIAGKYLEVPQMIKIDNKGEHDVQYEFLRKNKEGQEVSIGEGMSKKVKANLEGNLKFDFKTPCKNCDKRYYPQRRRISLGSFTETAEDSVIEVNIDKVYNLGNYFSAPEGQSAKEFLESAQINIQYALTAYTKPRIDTVIVKEAVPVPDYQQVEFIEVNYPDGRVNRIPLGVKVSPTGRSGSSSANARISRGNAPAINAQAQVHVVQKGETLFGIAKAYNTTVARLQILNDLKGQSIRTGQTLQLK